MAQSQKHPPNSVVIVHGGAGSWKEKGIAAGRNGVRAAAQAGYRELTRTRSALEAVLAAVRVLEDNPLFNCGLGSSLTIDGRVQMDAALMTSDGRFGAVGVLEDVQHPIDVALKVMTETSHLLLAGPGASRMARCWGFPRFDPTSEPSRQRLARLKTRGESSWMPEFKRYLDLDVADTVGAVALDRYGRFAVANSTGGVIGKLPGRVGDTPIYGAGTWAAPHGAATGTGIGEEIIRRFLSKAVCDLMRRHSAPRAVEQGIKGCRRVGVIALDCRGRVGVGYTTQNMPWASIRGGAEESGG